MLKIIKIVSKKASLALAVIFALSCICSISAKAEDWAGWTEEKIEEVWAAYVITSWVNVGQLNFSVGKDGSVTSADIPDDFRENYEPVLDDILGNSSYATVFSGETPTDKTVYKELLLAIAYTLNKEGNGLLSNGFDTETIDICFINKYIDAKASISSVRDSFNFLYKRLIVCEQKYCSAHFDSTEFYSIYANDEHLLAIVQGVIYGPGYVAECEIYSSSNAKDYYNTKDSLLKEWHTFANEVSGRYSAIKASSDHTIIG